jgi:transglutaminase-like putative cysteine protease
VSVEYSVAVNVVPQGARARVWFPVPKTDVYQTISNLAFSGTEMPQVANDAHGNRIAHALVPDGGRIVMRFDAVRRERIRTFAVAEPKPAPPDCCLHPDRLAPFDAKIRSWATEVAVAAGARTDLEKARAIYNHVVATVRYDKSGKGWGRGDIYYACETRRGNCTDFHAIFIGYCRTLGIPARFAIGVPLPAARGAVEIAGYHCWAEFFANGIGWIPIDASEGAKDPSRRTYFFGAHDENRIEFSRGRDLTLVPQQKSSPVNFLIDAYAELDGKPFSGVKTLIKFRDRE